MRTSFALAYHRACSFPNLQPFVAISEDFNAGIPAGARRQVTGGHVATASSESKSSRRRRWLSRAANCWRARYSRALIELSVTPSVLAVSSMERHSTSRNHNAERSSGGRGQRSRTSGSAVPTI